MKRMHGAALLVLLVLLFCTAAGLLLSRHVPNPQLTQKIAMRQQLNDAKEALLAFTVAYEDNYARPSRAYYPAPGYFPCPSTDAPSVDRAPSPPCRRLMLGRLPSHWEMRSGSGRYEALPAGDFQRHQEFWYALSDGFQDNSGSTPTINTTTVPTLTVDGRNDVIAIIFAPGAPINGQTRPSTQVRDYLEGENADGDAIFASTGPGEFNDQLVYITRDEFLKRLTERVAADLKRALDTSYDRTGAYPSTIPATAPAWFPMRWQSVTSYGSNDTTAHLCFLHYQTGFSLERASAFPRKEAGACPL